MNVSNSMFYNCLCSNEGGAIYFDSSNSFLRMICACGCKFGDYIWGQFANIYSSLENQVEYLSLSCGPIFSSGFCPIFIKSGNQRVYNTNSSMNNVHSYSGIGINSPLSFTSSYCSFSNNKVANSICINIFYSTYEVLLSYMNIVHNNSPSNGVLYCQGSGTKKLTYCIFHDNKNYLFFIYSGSLEVSISFIDHPSSSFTNNNAVSTKTNNSMTFRITYQIQFFNSLHCNADIPLQQKSPMNTPISTHKETPISTHKETPTKTIKYSPFNTLVETSKETHNAITNQMTPFPSPIQIKTESKSIRHILDPKTLSIVSVFIIFLVILCCIYCKTRKIDERSISLSNLEPNLV